MAGLVDRGLTPGLWFACQMVDRLEVHACRGRARLAPLAAALPDTRSPWFSVTKLFTAMAVLRLAAAQALDLDQPVPRDLAYLPWRGAPPTVRQLLSHTAGLRNPMPLKWIHPASQEGPSPAAMVERIGRRAWRPRRQPGMRMAYSNLGYLLLGLLVERVSGLAFTDYVDRHVLGPLGIAPGGFHLGEGAATGYSRTWSAMGLLARLLLPGRSFGPTTGGFTALQPFQIDGAPYGGLIGTVSEMLRLGVAMLADGQYEGRLVLPGALAEAALAPARLHDGTVLPIGLGWQLGALDDEAYAYHLGGGAGFRSELRVYPRIRYAVAVIANESSFDTDSLSRVLIEPDGT